MAIESEESASLDATVRRIRHFKHLPGGLGRTQDQMAEEFAAVTVNEPEKAAEIIHRGVKQVKRRILVGPDASTFDTLARLAPTRYYDVFVRLGSVLTGVARQGRSWRR
jgi:hypothetical protein